MIFSRSTDENGDTTTQAGPGRQRPGRPAPIANDSERQAVTFTAFDMDVHLRPEVHQIAVRARLTVRNDGKTPLAHIPLQLSSQLNWERIRVDGNDVPFRWPRLMRTPTTPVNCTRPRSRSLSLSRPAPVLTLDVTYSGTITPSAQRLIAIGTPEDVALHNRLGHD